MTAAAKNPYGVTPALEISDDEVTELEAPFVFTVRGKVGALKGNGSFSIDDYLSVSGQVEENVSEAIDLVAYDKASADLLRAAGHKVLQRILTAWFQTEGVGLGESDSSEI